ncbi:MAG: hypothetical protein PWP52_2034, partial [Bacteroidales bacterium]|nr:hypothetical protein [Bacteroidales bacterium]
MLDNKTTYKPNDWLPTTKKEVA